MAELMLGQPLFPGESGIDQLVEIIKVLGTPTREQIRTMNPNYMEHKFPQIKPHPFNKVFAEIEAKAANSSNNVYKVFRKATQDAIDLIAALLEYTPTQRLSAIDAMVHPFFDELRDPTCRFPDSRHQGGASKDLPELFNFTKHGRTSYLMYSTCIDVKIELSIEPRLNAKLIPDHHRKALLSKGLDIDNFQPLSKDEMIARLD